MRTRAWACVLAAAAAWGCASSEGSGGGESSGGSGAASGSGGAPTGGAAGAGAAAGSGGTAGSGGGAEWPNPVAPGTSDPWIATHHDQIVTMRPRVLALNFVNKRTNAEMNALLQKITAAIAEGTRPHGDRDPSAQPFLKYEIAYSVDLRDSPPPAAWPHNNSTRYPRENPTEGQWGFDYGKLFSQEYAGYFGIEDPDQPGKKLTLCELSEKGLVHEVWVYADADVPDAGAAEVLGIQPKYDDGFHRYSGVDLNRCAGNGCFDADDEIPSDCTRTLRIGFVNNTRGPGCFLESISHAIEAIGRSQDIPYFTQYFPEFAGFDLKKRYGLPFDSWYACNEPKCLSYPTTSSVSWNIGGQSGVVDPYVAVCGNAHFPPNGRENYDIVNADPVKSGCRGYRTAGGPGGGDPEELVSAADWQEYAAIASDCDGPFLVWWWQQFPGPSRVAKDSNGVAMKNWWPFLYY